MITPNIMNILYVRKKKKCISTLATLFNLTHTHLSLVDFSVNKVSVGVLCRLFLVVHIYSFKSEQHNKFTEMASNLSASADDKLIKNLESQLERLVDQLKDLEECKYVGI